MNRRILLSACLLLIFFSEAKAQEIGVFAGYLNSGKLDLSSIRSDLSLRDTGVYGARLEFDFHRYLGIEQNFAFSPRLFQSSLMPSAADVRGFLYSNDLVVNVPLSRFVPYATAGVGLMKPFGTGFTPIGMRFAGNYGGGIKLERLAGPIGLRFDVRDYLVPNVADNTLHLLEASGGLTFTFRKKR